MRYFDTGATRDSDENKYDYEGFLHPRVLERFAQYMHEHRKQADGKLRDSDNWQKGIPLDQYMKSQTRHFFDMWALHRADLKHSEAMVNTLCAQMFNIMGYLFEVLKHGYEEESIWSNRKSAPFQPGPIEEAINNLKPPSTEEYESGGYRAVEQNDSENASFCNCPLCFTKVDWYTWERAAK